MWLGWFSSRSPSQMLCRKIWMKRRPLWAETGGDQGRTAGQLGRRPQAWRVGTMEHDGSVAPKKLFCPETDAPRGGGTQSPTPPQSHSPPPHPTLSLVLALTTFNSCRAEEDEPDLPLVALWPVARATSTLEFRPRGRSAKGSQPPGCALGQVCSLWLCLCMHTQVAG